VVLRKNLFIQPCLPTLAKEPPRGLGWTHEVKFDGYRVQVHRDAASVAIYSRNAHDFTNRYPAIARYLVHASTAQSASGFLTSSPIVARMFGICRG
jgi:ATP-dependent DNA ligase